LNRHGGGPPRDFKSLASTSSATQALLNNRYLLHVIRACTPKCVPARRRDSLVVTIIIINFELFCQYGNVEELIVIVIPVSDSVYVIPNLKSTI
jgi:hypothetical protein